MHTVSVHWDAHQQYICIILTQHTTVYAVSFSGGHYTLGSIDKTLLSNVMTGQTSHRLYIDIRGLFFLPTAIVTGGKVTRVCVYGYPRVEHEEHIRDEDGNLDLSTMYAFLFMLFCTDQQMMNEHFTQE